MSKAKKPAKSGNSKTNAQPKLPMGTPDDDRLERIEKAHAVADQFKRRWEELKSETRNAKADYDEACKKRDQIIEHGEDDELPVGDQAQQVDDMGRPLHQTPGFTDPADVGHDD